MKLPARSGVDYVAVSVTAIVVNVVLTASKLTVGLLFGSVALIADGVHSLADIFGAAVVFIGLRVSRRPADVEHPYGYSKAEPITELVVAFIVILTGVFIIYDSATALYARHAATELQIGIIVAAISTAAAWFLSRYKQRIGMKIKSSALVAESKHSITDAVSSLAVVVGLVLTGLGYWYMDAIVGILISALIIHIGARVAKTSVDMLMDREAAPELSNRIRKTIESEPEVKKINYVHTRGSWSYKIVDVSITVSRGLAVRELSTVQERIKAGVFSEIPEVYQVNIMASADEDLLTIAVSSVGSGLRAAFADDLGKCEYFVIARVRESHIDLIGTFVNQYKAIERKKGARVADFMHEHGVDMVITGHAGEGAVQWLKGYGIDVKLVADFGYSVEDAIEASQLNAS